MLSNIYSEANLTYLFCQLAQNSRHVFLFMRKLQNHYKVQDAVSHYLHCPTNQDYHKSLLTLS